MRRRKGPVVPGEQALHVLEAAAEILRTAVDEILVEALHLLPGQGGEPRCDVLPAQGHHQTAVLQQGKAPQIHVVAVVRGGQQSIEAAGRGRAAQIPGGEEGQPDAQRGGGGPDQRGVEDIADNKDTHIVFSPKQKINGRSSE